MGNCRLGHKTEPQHAIHAVTAGRILGRFMTPRGLGCSWLFGCSWLDVGRKVGFNRGAMPIRRDTPLSDRTGQFVAITRSKIHFRRRDRPPEVPIDAAASKASLVARRARGCRLQQRTASANYLILWPSNGL
jgi:hypothetical protein